MAQLIVRNVEDEVVRALKVRAASKGRSAEAEHRAMLRDVLLGPHETAFKDLLLAMPGTAKGVRLARAPGRARRVRL